MNPLLEKMEIDLRWQGHAMKMTDHRLAKKSRVTATR